MLLGKLATFCDSLFTVMRALEASRTVPEHAEILTRALDAMIVADVDTAAELRLLRRTLVDIAESARSAGFEGAVGIEAVRALLDEMVEQAEPARGFLARSISNSASTRTGGCRRSRRRASKKRKNCVGIICVTL